jgi:hypothetical protein
VGLDHKYAFPGEDYGQLGSNAVNPEGKAGSSAVKVFATLSLQFPRAWWAPFISLCLLGFPGPNHLWVTRLVHGNLL